MGLSRILVMAGLVSAGAMVFAPHSSAQACGYSQPHSITSGLFQTTNGTPLPNALGFGAGLLATGAATVMLYQKWSKTQANATTAELPGIIHPEMLETLETEADLVGSQK